ncbi:ferredoxin [Nocardioides sp. CF8]|uniref:ferredoxin--NADP reductase n=1 Tax=Nocardioides sp. CF8 TaxID=110319 RepID=UPI00032ED996|nr:ferredoxin--NADP reductase [Nocardioides sp. CF8]EON23835.1 ferredoxin [Nocardioides sp. CF8]
MDTDSYLLEVREVVAETADASSIVFEVPADAAEAFTYRPGQFLTVGVPSDQTGLAARCYSICTPPGEPLTVTVKRTVEGYASNWLNDNLKPGDTVRVLPPSGIFSPKDWTADLLLFAGGSGVTPIMSIVRTALAEHSNRVVLFYANRDEGSVIFAAALRELAAAHPDRLQVVHWLESVQGLPSEDQLREFASAYTSWTSFCCGPAPFMKAVSNSLRALDFPRDRRHQEKFVSLGGNPFGDVEEVLAARASVEAADDADESDEAVPAGPSGPVKVEVELDGEEHVFDDWQPGEKLLDFLESKGVKAPYSCREGECSACAIRLVSGEVRMLHNDVLEQEDLDEGIRLGCQSVPATAETVKVSYS